MNSICLNGKIMPANEPVFMVDNRGYRYGDGLFETMKVVNNSIMLANYHFERLYSGLALMGFTIPAFITAGRLQEDVLHLCKKNKCEPLARVRLSVFRGNGGIFEALDEFQYTIECWPMDSSVLHLNENGLVIDVVPAVRKSCDPFANLKSANCLPYVIAARYAKERQLNECLVLNVHERIADATIANIFLIKNGELTTTPLSEGCVNGVMRRYLLDKLKITERQISVDDLEQADELFLTNAISGIRWVQSFRRKKFSSSHTQKIYRDIIQTISA